MDESVNKLYELLYGVNYQVKYEPMIFSRSEMIEVMRKALSEMKRYKAGAWTVDRVVELLADRSGLSTGKVVTLRECALKHHLSSERIRQVEATALRMLRHPRHHTLLLKVK